MEGGSNVVIFLTILQKEMKISINDVHKGLNEAGYIASKDIEYAVYGCANTETPLLIEGAPGVGKTELAKATAKALSLPFYRIQFYEGLTADKILYDYNYQRQLLTIEAIKPTLENALGGKNISEAIAAAKNIDFFGDDFLIERPILKSINGKERCVLLLDEIDKASEEIEYTLLEFLDEFSMTIPQYGTVVCPEDKRPIVFLTSNNYRELSDALRRRCNYLYIPKKSAEEMTDILKTKTQVSDNVIEAVVKCADKLNSYRLKQTPSVAEYIAWARYLESNMTQSFEDNDMGIFTIAKHEQDIEVVSKVAKEVLAVDRD